MKSLAFACSVLAAGSGFVSLAFVGCVGDVAVATADDGGGSPTGDTSTPDVQMASDASIPPDTSVQIDATQPDVADAGKGIRELYLIASTSGPQSSSASIEVVDLTSGKAVRDNGCAGALAMKYVGGSLYVVRGSGQSRISVIDPDTVAVTSTLNLAWDPSAAVFSADGSTVYVLRGDAFVEQIKVATGALTGEYQVTQLQGQTGTRQPLQIALNHAETKVGVTLFDGASSSVATVNISGTTLSPSNHIAPPAISGSNCGRENDYLAFSPDDTHLATWDANCDTIDSYKAIDLTRDDSASAQFTRQGGVGNAQIGYDGLGQIWAANVDTIFRVPSATFMPGGSVSGTLIFDTTGTTLWSPDYDPHNNGIFTVNLSTGATTKQNWDLSLIPQSVNIVGGLYVAR